MRTRWNGWGDETVEAAIPAGALALLERLVGPGIPPRDASLGDVLAAMPVSRLAGTPLGSDPVVSLDPEDRLRHARGQSLPDWIALRSGLVGRVPDGVARPATDVEVRRLFEAARQVGARLVPYGGGTSVVGGLGPSALGVPGAAGDADHRSVLILDLERLADLRRADERSGLATFGAGIRGPALEAALRERGRMLGHEPQSWELSTLGGWVVTRSSGQRSLGFGRIEALFAGGRLEAPAGTLELPTHPASAAGPDLRQVVLGSEGRLGILTEATVRTSPLPPVEVLKAAFLPDWEAGVEAVRELGDARIPLALIRLSTPLETRTTLALSGRDRSVSWLARYLRLRGLGPDRCLLLIGLTGSEARVAGAVADAVGILRRRRAVWGPTALGRAWWASRFRAPYLRNALWEAGYAVDTLETAIDWTRAPELAAAIGRTLRHGLQDRPESRDERVHAFTHLSHVYPSGTSIYTTGVFRLGPDPHETFARWAALKSAASREIVAAGGTISHQHGVGRDHAPYLEAEKGSLGLAAIRDLVARFDPDGLMDRGPLLGDEDAR